jgi:glyoxylase-like metal-dependent hydrolase (beta-lactamase superfamily II)
MMENMNLYSIPNAEYLQILSIEAGPVATNGYMLMDMQSQSAIIIDAPHESVKVFESYAVEKELKISALWLTHTHWDHTADAELCAKKGMDILVHPLDAYRLLDQAAHTVWPLPFKLGNVQYTGIIEQGDILTCGDWTCEVLHTPGHTEGGVCFVDLKHSCIFAGDTLFAGSIGRTDLPGGDMDTLLASIKKSLLNLPEDMIVFPGHGPLTTIGDEQENNPFLQ